MLIGPAFLLLVASAWGVLEVHSSTDTWIGLAAGRQIIAQTDWLNLRETFPIRDTFSFTFAGTTWYNQNWLSHVYFWLLYDRLGPNWVIYGTWIAGVATFWLAAAAVYVRTRSGFAALLFGAAVAFGCRDWFSARPATIQFLCFSALWLILSLLIDQRSLRRPAPDAAQRVSGRRWWAIALLVPLLIAWGHAHGSFIMGYGLVGLFLGCWAVAAGLQRLWPLRVHVALTAPQAGAVAGAALLALFLTVWWGPFGWENFTHQFKVAESEAFRQVGEWKKPDGATDSTSLPDRIAESLKILLTGTPPDLNRVFPPVSRFWAILRILLAAILLIVGLRLIFGRRRSQTDRAAGPSPPWRPHGLLFDVAGVAIGFGLTFFARRFVPLLWILAGPALALWLARVAEGIGPRVQRTAGLIARTGAAVAAIFLLKATIDQARRDLVTPFADDPNWILLDRVTHRNLTMVAGTTFIARNELPANLVTEWTQAGVVMFFAPTARVFMDGRAQQTYSEAHYREHSRVMNHHPADGPEILGLLRSKGADAALLRFRRDMLLMTLTSSPEWMTVMASRDHALLLRVESPPLLELRKREDAGVAWWPDEPLSAVGRGELLLRTEPPDPDRALATWQAGLDRDPMLGTLLYEKVLSVFAARQKWGDAREFLTAQADKLRVDPSLSDAQRMVLREALARAEQVIAARAGNPPAP